MPSPSADLEWLMHLFSGYYPSSHGPERSLLLGPLTCGQESFPFCQSTMGAGHVLEWRICVNRTWLRSSLAVPVLLSARAPWAWVTPHLQEEPETKAWESWEPLRLVCRHTGGLTHLSAGLILFSS